MVSYSKWNDLSSDEESPRRRKVLPVRKQAVLATASAEQTLAQQAEESRQAAEELAKLQERAAKLQRDMEEHQKLMMATGDPSSSDSDSHSDEYSADFESEEVEESGAEQQVQEGGDPPLWKRPPQLGSELESGITRRRGVDRTRETEEERVFEERPAPDGGRGQEVAAGLRCPDVTLASGTTSGTVLEARSVASERPKKPSLRRLKHLDSEVAAALQRECGLDLSMAEAFRLVMDNKRSHLKNHTSVLVLLAGERFLCQEASLGSSAGSSDTVLPAANQERASVCQAAASDRSTAALQLSAAAAAAAAAAAVPAAPAAESPEEDSPLARSAAEALGTAAAVSAGAGDGSQGCTDIASEDSDLVEVRVRFFRATPRVRSLARRVGRVPVLHVGIQTSDGLGQAMEFLGIHQRRYLAEEQPSDAIAQNLVESLLRVALEFVFHPSRSRWAKRQLVLKECSTSPEALASREELLPGMVEGIRRMSKTIEVVRVEIAPKPEEVRIGAEGGSGDRSFLVLDEDAVRVAPLQQSMSQAPSAGKSFQGLGKGFLNSKEAKMRGLSAPEQPAEAAPAADSLGPSSWASPEPQVQPRLCTEASERAAMILPAADLYPPLPEEVRGVVVRAGGATPAQAAADLQEREAQEQEAARLEAEEQQPPASLSALAEQLFGDLLPEEEPESLAAALADQPMALSTQPTSHAASAPLRLLQRRRHERAGSKEAPEAAPPLPMAEENSEDLVNLWMKQRW